MWLNPGCAPKGFGANSLQNGPLPSPDKLGTL